MSMNRRRRYWRQVYQYSCRCYDAGLRQPTAAMRRVGWARYYDQARRRNPVAYAWMQQVGGGSLARLPYPAKHRVLYGALPADGQSHEVVAFRRF